MKSQSAELSAACFISATWLIYMLPILPDTRIKGVACACFLKRFVSILKSVVNIEDKILSMLALKSFLHFHGCWLMVISHGPVRHFPSFIKKSSSHLQLYFGVPFCSISQ